MMREAVLLFNDCAKVMYVMQMLCSEGPVLRCLFGSLWVVATALMHDTGEPWPGLAAIWHLLLSLASWWWLWWPIDQAAVRQQAY